MNEAENLYCDHSIERFIEEEMTALRSYANGLKYLPAADLNCADTYFLNNIQ